PDPVMEPGSDYESGVDRPGPGFVPREHRLQPTSGSGRNDRDRGADCFGSKPGPLWAAVDSDWIPCRRLGHRARSLAVLPWTGHHAFWSSVGDSRLGPGRAAKP